MNSPRIFIRLVLAFALMGWGQFVFAEDYYWKFSNAVWGVYPSPTAACQSYVSQQKPENLAQYIRTEINSPTSAVCHYSYQVRTNYRQDTTAAISRSGTSCPPDTVLNDQTAGCEPPPPECAVGDPGIFKGSDGSVITSGGRRYVISEPPSSVCYNQCSFSVSDRASSCFLTPGSTTSGFCNYLGTGTGENCSATDAALGQTGDALNSPDTPDVPPSDPNDPGCPTGYSWSGTTCVKSPTDGEGDGTGDGDSDGDNGGGGGGGGSGDGGGDGGSDGGGDGSGDGDGDGNGDGTGNGDGAGEGEGEGEGDCDPATDPNKCGQSSVGGESCEAPLVCEGDAVQCAILRKNKEQLCQWKYDAPVKAEIESALSGPEYELEEKSTAVGSLFTEAVNKGRWLPSNCPSPETFTVMGRSYSISWEPVCRFATAIGPLVVMLASIFFAVSISRALKGS